MPDSQSKSDQRACRDCGSDTDTYWHEVDGAWVCEEVSDCIEHQWTADRAERDRLRAENERLREQYEALQRTWHKSIEAVHLAVAEAAGLRETLRAVSTLAKDYRIGSNAALRQIRDIAELAAAFDETEPRDA